VTLGATTLDEPTVEVIAALHADQRALAVSVEDLCALVGAIPQVALSASGTALFDRLFNPPSSVAADGAFPKPTVRLIHPALRAQSTGPIDAALPRLTSGLAVDLDALGTLVRALAPHLAQEATPGFDPAAASDDDRYFVLSAPNLSLLYRHARLARLLSVSV